MDFIFVIVWTLRCNVRQYRRSAHTLMMCRYDHTKISRLSRSETIARQAIKSYATDLAQTIRLRLIGPDQIACESHTLTIRMRFDRARSIVCELLVCVRSIAYDLITCQTIASDQDRLDITG